MLTQIVAGRVYDYSHCVGRSAPSGLGFNHPMALALGEDDTVFVLNRGEEYIPGIPWNRSHRGARVSKLSIGKIPGDEEFLNEFGKSGDDDGGLIWPSGLAIDSQEKVYVTDEWLNRVTIFDNDGNFVGLWGTPGDGDGEFNGPSGIAMDRNDDVFIVDSRNHRVQKFTKDGKFQAKWGSYGSHDGEFNTPWGITVDHEGYVYVADHKNHTAQKFTADGEFVARFGSFGAGRGQLNRPSDVAVDPDGDVYVCDWANNRVQIFASDGRFLTNFIGDAQELSKWATTVVEASAEVMKRRREVRSLEPEWRFAFPTAVTFDPKLDRLLVADCQRNRLQIYNKLNDYSEPQRNL